MLRFNLPKIALCLLQSSGGTDRELLGFGVRELGVILGIGVNRCKEEIGRKVADDAFLL